MAPVVRREAKGGGSWLWLCTALLAIIAVTACFVAGFAYVVCFNTHLWRRTGPLTAGGHSRVGTFCTEMRVTFPQAFEKGVYHQTSRYTDEEKAKTRKEMGIMLDGPTNAPEKELDAEDDRAVVQLDANNFIPTILEGGKTGFVKFYAPWCGHCKKLAPTWNYLGVEFEQSEIVIGKVDCTIEKPICETMGVKGLPTLKFYKHQYGGERLGEVYDGARDYATLRNFVIDTLGPQCSDAHFDKCDATEQAILTMGRGMTEEERSNRIIELEIKLNEAMRAFDEREAALKAEVDAVDAERNKILATLVTAEFTMLRQNFDS